MKKILSLCISIIIISLSCSTKGDKPILNGLFELKLGMSEEDARKIVDTNLLSEKNDYFTSMDRNGVLEGKVKTLHLERYVVDSNFVIEDIAMSFFEDELYNIYIGQYNAKTENLLENKYGLKRKKNNREKEERTMEWYTNDKNISCISTVSTSDDSFRSSYSFFLMNKKVIFDIYVLLGLYDDKSNADESLIDRL